MGGHGAFEQKDGKGPKNFGGKDWDAEIWDACSRAHYARRSSTTHAREMGDHCARVGVHVVVRPTPLRVQEWVARHWITGVIND